jgi:hypothetical protein
MDDKIIDGFIMNKLLAGNYIGGRHTSVDNLPKSYDRAKRGFFPNAVKRLRKAGLIHIHPSNGEQHVSAVLAMRVPALELANSYRVSVDLPPLGLDLKEQRTPAAGKKSRQ